MAESNRTADDTWYVCIQRMCGVRECTPFMGAGGEAYRTYAGLVKERGGEVVAEQFGVSDAVVNNITGFDESGTHTGKSPIKELLDGVNTGRIPDVKDALAALCRVA